MFSNLSDERPEAATYYPPIDSSLPFSEYITQCQDIIRARRTDLTGAEIDNQKIVAANSPFELRATDASSQSKVGILLIHGLLDCPFTYREVSTHLQQHGHLIRSILLPGHGTRPSDLMNVTYQEWLKAVSYGVDTLAKEVEHIYLIGYSTGAALSVYHALNDNRINGIVLLSPAIKVRAPVDIAANWIYLANYLGKDRDWIAQGAPNDYAKYRSVTYNSLKQVTRLSDAVRVMSRDKPIQQPMLMVLSREDETISSKEAIDFFSAMQNPASEMLLYSGTPQHFADKRIKIHTSHYPALNIINFSHVSLPFSADNPHYGQHGDYPDASTLERDKYMDGAYNRIETNAFDVMAKYNLVECKRRVLTYNPDFNNMMNRISQFIETVK